LRPHDFTISVLPQACIRIFTDSFNAHDTRAMQAAKGRNVRNTHCALTVLVFRIDLLDRPEHRFFELLDLGIGRILPDFLEFFVEIK
jgi:hypothetical protein